MSSGGDSRDGAKVGAEGGIGADLAPLGVLSVHFEGGRCRVNCPFCYLGRRAGTPQNQLADDQIALLAQALEELSYRELAVALSEPVEPVLAPLRLLVEKAQQRRRLVAITTTLEVTAALPAELLAGVGRLNLSIDPFKLRAPKAKGGLLPPRELAARLAAVRAGTAAELVLIVTLSTPPFAEALWSGLLAELLALPEVDRVALNALKPPPPWCDRAFWLRALQQIAPLLRQHLDRRLFLDCYVAARILGIGGCPARPDLSPLSVEEQAAAGSGLAFRGCVYQPAPDFVAHSGDELRARLAGFTPPAVCPFPVD